jgi:hypothetical protein
MSKKKIYFSSILRNLELIGLAELIKSTNQPFNPINLQSLTSAI